MSTKYTIKDLETCVHMLEEKFNFDFKKLHINVYEFFVDPAIPIFRVFHSKEKGYLALAFNIQTNINDAIIIFEFLKITFNEVGLGNIYYKDKNNNIHIGTEAEIALQNDVGINSPIKTNSKQKPHVEHTQTKAFYSEDELKACEYFMSVNSTKKAWN